MARLKKKQNPSSHKSDEVIRPRNDQPSWASWEDPNFRMRDDSLMKDHSVVESGLVEMSMELPVEDFTDREDGRDYRGLSLLHESSQVNSDSSGSIRNSSAKFNRTSEDDAEEAPRLAFAIVWDPERGYSLYDESGEQQLSPVVEEDEEIVDQRPSDHEYAPAKGPRSRSQSRLLVFQHSRFVEGSREIPPETMARLRRSIHLLNGSNSTVGTTDTFSARAAFAEICEEARISWNGDEDFFERLQELGRPEVPDELGDGNGDTRNNKRRHLFPLWGKRNREEEVEGTGWVMVNWKL